MAAIYMWIEMYEEEYTTTLYPLETQDAIVVSIAFEDGYMEYTDFDPVAFGTDLVSITVLVILLDAPEQTDSISQGTDLASIVIYKILLDAPEQTDSISQGTELVNITVDAILITTYMPDQGVITSANLDSASCYMTSV